MKYSWRVLLVIVGLLFTSLALASLLKHSSEPSTPQKIVDVSPENIASKRNAPFRTSQSELDDEEREKVVPTHVPLPEVYLEPPPKIVPPKKSVGNTTNNRNGLLALSQTIGKLFEGASSEEDTLSDTPSNLNTEESDSSPELPKEDLRRDLLSAAGGPPAPKTSSTPPKKTEPTSTPTPVPSPTPAPLLPWVSGQARGYTMLYAMQEEARPTVESELKILLDARVRNVYIGVLTDGTFGWNPQYLSALVRRLNREDRSLTLVLYLTNGPTMRLFDTTEIDTDFSKTDPVEFRSEIQFNPVAQETFKQLARRTLPIFSLNRSLSPKNRNIVIPMLEDNLDSESFATIANLTREILGGVATVMRNPCPNCFEGNDSSRQGTQFEIHGEENLSLTSRYDGYSLDGTGYRLSEESAYVKALPVRRLKILLELSVSSSMSYFGLWREDRQGLRPASAPTLPELRSYAIPTPEQKIIEIELLRYGLREEQTSDQ